MERAIVHDDDVIVLMSDIDESAASNLRELWYEANFINLMLGQIEESLKRHGAGN